MRDFQRPGLLVLTILLLTGCGTVGHDVGGIANFDQVSPVLYRGAQPTQSGIHTLQRYHIQTVINLRDGDDTVESKMVREAGMTYIRLPLDAETVTPADAEHFLTLIAAAPKPIFVHCLVGRDRTGLAVAAYRVREQGWTEQAARQDLIDHGHFWLFFPKVRAALTTIAQSPPTDAPMVVSTKADATPAMTQNQ